MNGEMVLNLLGKKGKKSNSTAAVDIKVGRVAQTDDVMKVRRGKIQIGTVSSSPNKEEITQTWR